MTSTADTRLLTGDEYIELLKQRQGAWVEAQSSNPMKLKFAPLLEWFIQDGDEDLVDPDVIATPEPQPKRTPKPRTYRSAESLRAERDRVQARRDAITGRDCGDNAVVNLSPSSRSRAAARAGRRRFAQLDRDLERYTKLTARLDDLNGRIARAEAREAN